MRLHTLFLGLCSASALAFAAFVATIVPASRAAVLPPMKALRIE